MQPPRETAHRPRDWFNEFLDETIAKNPGAAFMPGEKPPTPDPDIAASITTLGRTSSPERPWLLGPCIMPGDCVYFVGEGGAGKSTLASDLITAALDPGRSECLAGAWRVNRELIPPDPRALIINAETSMEDAWEIHLQRANVAAGHTVNSPEDVEIRQRCDFLDASALSITPANLTPMMQALSAHIATAGYTFVIIDPIYTLFAPESPGDDLWVTAGLRTFLSTLKAANITTIALSHPPNVPAKATLQSILKPYGTSQQKGQMDAWFGLRRADNHVELIKFKDRRAYWIPPKSSRITLQFGRQGGGYSSHRLQTPWPYENPNAFILTPSQWKVLAQLPPEPFEPRHLEGKIRKATLLTAIADAYLPQNLLTVETLPGRGSPKRYHWTELGLRARKQAKESQLPR